MAAAGIGRHDEQTAYAVQLESFSLITTVHALAALGKLEMTSLEVASTPAKPPPTTFGFATGHVTVSALSAPVCPGEEAMTTFPVSELGPVGPVGPVAPVAPAVPDVPWVPCAPVGP